MDNSIQRRSGNLMDSQWKSGGMLEIPVNSKRAYFMCSFQQNCSTIQTAHSSSKGGEWETPVVHNLTLSLLSHIPSR